MVSILLGNGITGGSFFVKAQSCREETNNACISSERYCAAVSTYVCNVNFHLARRLIWPHQRVHPSAYLFICRPWKNHRHAFLQRLGCVQTQCNVAIALVLRALLVSSRFSTWTTLHVKRGRAPLEIRPLKIKRAIPFLSLLSPIDLSIPLFFSLPLNTEQRIQGEKNI